jgi:hypothetical protein
MIIWIPRFVFERWEIWTPAGAPAILFGFSFFVGSSVPLAIYRNSNSTQASSCPIHYSPVLLFDTTIQRRKERSSPPPKCYIIIRRDSVQYYPLNFTIYVSLLPCITFMIIIYRLSEIVPLPENYVRSVYWEHGPLMFSYHTNLRGKYNVLINASIFTDKFTPWFTPFR